MITTTPAETPAKITTLHQLAAALEAKSIKHELTPFTDGGGHSLGFTVGRGTWHWFCQHDRPDAPMMFTHTYSQNTGRSKGAAGGSYKRHLIASLSRVLGAEVDSL